MAYVYYNYVRRHVFMYVPVRMYVFKKNMYVCIIRTHVGTYIHTCMDVSTCVRVRTYTLYIHQCMGLRMYGLIHCPPGYVINELSVNLCRGGNSKASS